MKLLLRASCGHEALFNPPGAENWSEEKRRDFILMVQGSALCDDCGALAEAEYQELEMFENSNEEELL